MASVSCGREDEKPKNNIDHLCSRPGSVSRVASAVHESDKRPSYVCHSNKLQKGPQTSFILLKLPFSSLVCHG